MSNSKREGGVRYDSKTILETMCEGITKLPKLELGVIFECNASKEIYCDLVVA
jgi:hypothetical protein